MSRILPSLLIAPLVLVLAACAAPAPTAPVSSTPPVAAPSETPSPEPVVPVVANAADYLLDGNKAAPVDGEWFERYGFFTDDSKVVYCDFVIFSGDTPSLSCSVVTGSESLITYPSPVTAEFTCDGSTDIWSDGTRLGLGGKGQPEAAMWSGCATDDTADHQFDAVRNVLPPSTTLEVEPFSCSVEAAIASCELTDGSASITYGLSEATLVNS